MGRQTEQPGTCRSSMNYKMGIVGMIVTYGLDSTLENLVQKGGPFIGSQRKRLLGLLGVE